MSHLTRAAVALGAAAVAIAVIAGGTTLAAWIVGYDMANSERGLVTFLALLGAIALPIAIDTECSGGLVHHPTPTPTRKEARGWEP